MTDVQRWRAAVAKALTDEGAGPGNSIHGWRCEHPDRYGPCDCVAEVAEVVVATVLPLVAAEHDRTVRDALTKVLLLHQRCENGHCSCGALRWPCSTARVCAELRGGGAR